MASIWLLTEMRSFSEQTANTMHAFFKKLQQSELSENEFSVLGSGPAVARNIDRLKSDLDVNYPRPA
jgi:hypothetical protein